MQQPYEEVRIDIEEETHDKVRVVVVPPEHPYYPFDENLEYLDESRQRMLSIQQDLTAVIGAMDYPSYISQLANYWGEMPEWRKIVGGFGLSFGLLTLGLITHIGLLITLSAFSAISYFGGGFFLDDHYVSNQRSKSSLQRGIVALTSMLGTLMESMERAVHELGQQNVKFSTNNERLEAQVSVLRGHLVASL